MKVKALKSFEGIKDIERNVFPKAGDVWEVSEKRANFLKNHGVVEFVEKEIPQIKNVEETIERIEESAKEEVEVKSKKKKTSKK